METLETFFKGIQLIYRVKSASLRWLSASEPSPATHKTGDPTGPSHRQGLKSPSTNDKVKAPQQTEVLVVPIALLIGPE